MLFEIHCWMLLDRLWCFCNYDVMLVAYFCLGVVMLRCFFCINTHLKVSHIVLYFQCMK
jgi:hypothetical protein